MATNTQLAQEAAHHKAQTQLAMQSSRRHLAIAALATSIEWEAGDGSAVRVEPADDLWCIRVDGIPQSSKDNVSSAVDLAACIAPPADADLAALLTWTACGKTRV